MPHLAPFEPMFKQPHLSVEPLTALRVFLSSLDGAGLRVTGDSTEDELSRLAQELVREPGASPIRGSVSCERTLRDEILARRPDIVGLLLTPAALGLLLDDAFSRYRSRWRLL